MGKLSIRLNDKGKDCKSSTNSTNPCKSLPAIGVYTVDAGASVSRSQYGLSLDLKRISNPANDIDHGNLQQALQILLQCLLCARFDTPSSWSVLWDFVPAQPTSTALNRGTYRPIHPSPVNLAKLHRDYIVQQGKQIVPWRC